jgi:hypothetical protein
MTTFEFEEQLVDGSMVVCVHAICSGGRVLPYFAVVLEPYNDNPFLKVAGAFGMMGLIRLIEAFEEWRGRCVTYPPS